ncbi:hypothetical protein D3C71_1439140 [compost metagenome]|nr:hypothetical protein [Serratia liquefaciens]
MTGIEVFDGKKCQAEFLHPGTNIEQIFRAPDLRLCRSPPLSIAHGLIRTRKTIVSMKVIHHVHHDMRRTALASKGKVLIIQHMLVQTETQFHHLIS